MSTFSVTIKVANPNLPELRTWRSLVATVDSGASLTTIPANLLGGLGIASYSTRPFVLADGRRVESPVGNALIRIDGEAVTDLIVLGEPNEPVLLGARTLEGLFLGVDPVNKRLVPVHGLRYLNAHCSMFQ